MFLHANTQVLGVLPERDSAANVGRELLSSVLGAVVEVLKFLGPAYRAVPKAPLVSPESLGALQSKCGGGVHPRVPFKGPKGSGPDGVARFLWERQCRRHLW